MWIGEEEMRGALNVLSAILLVLVATSLLAIIYPWANSLATQLSASMHTYSMSIEDTLESFVEIYPPPGQITVETNLVGVVHNSGLRALSGVHVYIIKPDGSIYYPTLMHIDVNGNTTTVTNGGPANLDRGETLVVFFPETNDVLGYTIVVSGEGLIMPYVVSIP